MNRDAFKVVLDELRDEIRTFGKGRILNALEPGEEHDEESGEHTDPYHLSGKSEHMKHHGEEEEEENENDY